MRLVGIVAMAAILPGSFATQKSISIQSSSMKIEDAPGTMVSNAVLVNCTEDLTRAPSKPVATTLAEKPAWEASVMGLVVFSAAGLFLL
ncbi:uncharacterized protein GGS25DRAFT_209588 [Hypoxylon fragiforme]|uniref:uncharacterized protein n=1 Tax=Hypoxylon fragiforme TaxID=63214 RepID=UPI0020C5C550|nr:uncharacterized protein GGS25DRAFT_209588 [Hypoxylon fragiforme]KAI2611771.1 hypothetical protein GGS25DRAFT_209588 [Hypoxylon fragiforme]